MYTPNRIFGFPAKPKGTMGPSVEAQVDVGGLTVEVLRYNIADFEIDGLDVSDGSFLVYHVATAEHGEFLSQSRSVFFVSSDHPAPKRKSEDLPEGDGVAAPKWHKCDRHWPVRDDRPYSFLGQGYYGQTVFYLFVPDAKEKKLFAIFHDDIARQDAEEHYALEAKAEQKNGG